MRDENREKGVDVEKRRRGKREEGEGEEEEAEGEEKRERGEEEDKRKEGRRRRRMQEALKCRKLAGLQLAHSLHCSQESNICKCDCPTHTCSVCTPPISFTQLRSHKVHNVIEMLHVVINSVVYSKYLFSD